MLSQRIAAFFSRAFVGFWLLFWSICTVILDVGFLYDMARQQAASAFPAVEGAITDAKVAEESDADGTSYGAQLRYAYEVAGRNYTGGRDRYSKMFGSRKFALGVVQAHPLGSKVTVYYNPADPSDALLRPGLSAFDFFMLLFLLPFNIIAVGGWALALKAMRRAGEMPPGLRILNRETECRVRPAWSSPVVAAACATLITSFVLVFVVSFTTDAEPSVGAVVAAWGAVFAAAAIAWVRAVSGRYDLSVDRLHDTISLPARFLRSAPPPVPRSAFFAVDLIERTHTDSDGDTTIRYVPTLRWRGEDGQPAEAAVFPQASRQHGQNLARRLREIIVPERAAAPSR